MPTLAKPRKRSTIFKILICLSLAIGWSGFAARSALARAVNDPTDPAFNGSVSVQLPPPELGPTDTSVQFQRNGVTFFFESLDGVSLNAGNGISIGRIFPSFQGVIVTITPPVSAIGFVGEALDGDPNGTFIGTLGNEDAGTLFQGFFGAADIGDISAVQLPDRGGFFLLTELTFVPPTGVPAGNADLDLLKTPANPIALHSEQVQFDLDLDNLGPNTAKNVSVTDFLDPDLAFDGASNGGVFDPVANVVRWLPGDLAASGNLGFSLNGTTPPAIGPLYCGGRVTNVAVASSSTPDADLSNNLSVAITRFGIPPAQLPTQEICGNGIDDDCDGQFECADADCAAFCRPTLPLDPDGDGDPACLGGLLEGASGQSFLVPGLCAPDNNRAENHTCRASGICGDAPLPAFCCDLNSSLFISETCQRTGCAPVDPNFKQSDPPVNIAGLWLHPSRPHDDL